jgi:dihydroflavonol-4-reductase
VQKAVAQGLDAVIVTPAYIGRAGDVYSRASSVLVLVAHGRIPVSIPGGLNVVHIADVVEGHLAALESGCPGERYILGGQNMTHSHFLRLAAEAAGTVPPRMVLPARIVRPLARLVKASSAFVKLPVDGELLRLAGYYFYYDTRKSVETFGLAAPRPVETGLQDAVAWFMDGRE